MPTLNEHIHSGKGIYGNIIFAIVRYSFLILLLILIAIALDNSLAHAQNDERITINKSDIPADVLKDIETKKKIQVYGSWIGLGRELGTAVDSSLGALTHRADEFSKTNVGKWTMLLVIWKIAGISLVRMLFGILLWFIITPCFIWSYRRTAMSRTYLNNTITDKDGTVTRHYVTKEGDGPTQLSHAALYGVFLGIEALLMFAGA